MIPTCEILIGDVRAKLRDGRFQKGQHWRKPAPYWEREWLRVEYEDKQRSSGDIAAQFGVGSTAIHFWLGKHGIPRRSVEEARAVKHWGVSGEANPMFGRRGPLNPNWKGGLTPLRQRIYSTPAWRTVSRKVRKRDRVCRRCGSGEKTELHHIEPFYDAPLLVFDPENLILLCAKCHRKIRGREKWWRKRLKLLVLASKEAVA